MNQFPIRHSSVRHLNISVCSVSGTHFNRYLLVVVFKAGGEVPCGLSATAGGRVKKMTFDLMQQVRLLRRGHRVHLQKEGFPSCCVALEMIFSACLAKFELTSNVLQSAPKG